MKERNQSPNPRPTLNGLDLRSCRFTGRFSILGSFYRGYCLIIFVATCALRQGLGRPPSIIPSGSFGVYATLYDALARCMRLWPV